MLSHERCRQWTPGQPKLTTRFPQVKLHRTRLGLASLDSHSKGSASLCHQLHFLCHSLPYADPYWHTVLVRFTFETEPILHMRAAGSLRGTGTEPFELRKARAGSYKSMKVMCCLRTVKLQRLAFGTMAVSSHDADCSCYCYRTLP